MNLRLSEDGTKILATFQYDPALVAKVKSIPGARWRNGDKCWVLPKEIDALVAAWDMGVNCVTDPVLMSMWSEWNMQKKMNLEHKKHGPYTDTDFAKWTFKTKPYNHQMKALDLCIQNQAFALLMEMGTGKTWVMVNLLEHLKMMDELKRPALVVCPLSVCSVWGGELVKHSDNLNARLLCGTRYERLKALNEPADTYVVNYEGLRVIKEELLQKNFSMVICDESQKIKNRTAQQSKIVYELGKRAERRYILTGTMIVNNPLDSFGQFKFLNESILGSNFFAFQNRYAIMVQHGRVRFPARFVNVDELAKKIEPWSYRVTKAECLDLPEKIYETRHVELSDKARAIYKQLATELVAEVEHGGPLVTAPIILTKLLRFSQLTAGFTVTEDGALMEVGNEKLRVLEEILDEAEGKVVVWVKFRHELKMVGELLNKIHVGYVALSGETAQKDRETNLRRFREDDVVRVFVAQLEAGGVGIDLTAASTCVYMSNSYSHGTRDQSESRIHRNGQKNNCLFIDVVARGTIDEKVITTLKTKKDLAAIINQDPVSFVHNIMEA